MTLETFVWTWKGSVAFYHKLQLTVDRSQNNNGDAQLGHDNLDKLPDLLHPILLEIQSVGVHREAVKTMFNNGSTACLVTHSFLDRAGLKG